MSSKAFVCRCGHPQGDHKFSIGVCTHGCGCTQPRRRNGRHLVILECVYRGVPGKHAPTYRVRCPDCKRVYSTSCWLPELLRREHCRACHDGERLAKTLTRRTPRKPGPFDATPASRFGHGTRARYNKGCRCEQCREASNAYERARQKLVRAGDRDGLVDAARVRRHLAELSAVGIGRYTVADISGVSRTSLTAIADGTKTKLRRKTAARILAVTREATNDAKLVDAGPTRRRVERLLREGFTKGQIARRLGCQIAAMQILKGARVTAKTEHKVERLYREIME